MRSGQTTITDIAKKLNISPSTVSRALKGHPDISLKTKNAVNELAERMHYRPNAVALSLRHSKTNTIGLIIPQIVHHFFSSIISGIEEVARQAGYHVMICQSNESYEREVQNTQALFSSRVDGILVSVSKETRDFQHFVNLQESGIPLVFFDRICSEIEADSVVVDDETGAYNLVCQMIDEGCRRILYLGSAPHLLIGINRQNGYLKALKEFGISPDEELMINCDTFDIAMQLVPEIARNKNFDGVFAVNDETAIAAMLALRSVGKRIPEDILVGGFSNSLISEMTTPALTSVDQPGAEMGSVAASLLLDKLSGKREPSEIVNKVLKTHLIIRGSTKKIVL